MAQGFDLNSQEKYAKSYEEVGFKISEMTGGKKAVLLDFICRLIHAYLIGNDDFHLKNISLQRRLDNKTLFYDALMPNYDALFVQAFSNASQTHFLALDFFADDYFSDSFLHYGFYTGHDFIELGAKLGIPQKPISTFISKIETRLPKLLQIIGSSYMPEDMKKRSVHIVKDRSKGIFIRNNL